MLRKEALLGLCVCISSSHSVRVMMKFLKVTLKQAAFGALTLALIAVGRIQEDPSDDFSFSLHFPRKAAFFLMSDLAVHDVLNDRIDLISKAKVPLLAQHLLELCDEYRFDPAFILSLIEVESGFRVRAMSPAGAVGLMQLMPSTAKILGQTLKDTSSKNPNYSRLSRVSRLDWKAQERPGLVTILKDPFVNIELGIAYLAWLRDRYHGLPPFYLVAAYNVGPAKIDQLLSHKSFKPVNTKRYYEAIRKNIPHMRYYRRSFLREKNV